MKLRFHGRMEGYNSERFRKVLIAGVIVGIVALPLAMAFAIASGVPPDRGFARRAHTTPFASART